MITFMKFDIFPPLIMVTLLATLRRPYLLPDHLNLFSRLLHNLRTQYQILTGLIPTKWCPTSPPIQSFERHHPDTRMETVI
ncbi:hypothetical protein A2U01_0064395, partial [Trifolium medium]|nr:hypothetical protein [Trifolium medium]